MSDPFDAIVAQLRRDPNTYEPDGSGYWSNGLPCPTCGSISVLLDPIPACVVCTERVEKMRVAGELALAHLDTLVAVAQSLPAEQKGELRLLALMANVQLQRVLWAVGE